MPPSFFSQPPPHVQVLALVRPTSATAALEARAAASAAGPSSLNIARVDLTAPDADAAVAKRRRWFPWFRG